MPFKFELGVKVKDKVTGYTGTITQRSECLEGPNGYLVERKGLQGDILKEGIVEGRLKSIEEPETPQEEPSEAPKKDL